jgi:Uma2 family endonuclease
MVITTRGMTVEEYQDLVYSDPDRMWELYDGQPKEKPGMSWDHLDVVGELAYLLRRQLDRREHRVFSEGRVRRPEATVFMPDILVVPTALGETWRGRPGTLAIFPEPLPLVVEVWSRSTGDYDVMTKLPVYRQRGDREIWLVNPYERTLTSWRRQPDGSYNELVFRSGVVEAAALPDVTIRLDEVFDDATPNDQ